MQIIETDADIRRLTNEFVTAVPVFAPVLARTGPLPLRRRAGGFAGLLQIVLGQQVSVAAARAIWGRVCAAGADDPVVFHRLTDAAILDFGFSRPKLRYARAICAANMDFETLVDAPDDVVFDRLTAITGIGPWTAQIYLMSCLGRVDIFPAADLALQEATRHLLNTTDRPNTRLMTHIAKDWAPYRSIAARALWADYAILKKKDGVV